MKPINTAKYFSKLLIIWMILLSSGSIHGQGAKTLSLSLTPGWNWISINVGNPDMSIGTVLGSLTLENGDYIKNQDVSATWYDGTGWFGELTTISPEEMYKLKIAQANEFSYEGTPVDACIPIAINIGWNWIGYPPQADLPIEEALASINPVTGDYIKSQSLSSTYYDGSGWFGELVNLSPGEGYMLKCSHDEVLTYPCDEGACSFSDARDGREYECVTIGTQTWMAENLAWLPSVSPLTEGSLTELYYYVAQYQGADVSEAKATNNFTTYGVLYNYEASLTACPAGWHLPTDEEWKTLEIFLGMSSSDAEAFGWNRSLDVGNKMKSETMWSNNGNGDNSSGFNAIPGGHRSFDGGLYSFGDGTNFWSSSPSGLYSSFSRFLYYDKGGVGRAYQDNRNAYSIRCLKN